MTSFEKKVEERTRELETANHKITNIVESISDGFLALDKEWRYLYLNHNPYLHEGRTAQELIGENLWTIFPEVVGTFWYQEFHRAMEERITVTFESPSAYQGIWYEARVYPFEDGICCFFKDITDKKRYEQELKRLSGLDLIGQMAAGISHEIRNPMTTVRGFLQLLSTKEDCLKYEEFFTLMIDELDRANSIISQESRLFQCFRNNVEYRPLLRLLLVPAFHNGFPLVFLQYRLLLPTRRNRHKF